MITLLIGENSFEIERALDEIANDFNGNIEKIDGIQLQLTHLPDILMGISLFNTARTVVIRNLSSNKSIWTVFGDWLSKLSSDIHLVLVEPKPDKRTATFKLLKDYANVKEFQPWAERDTIKAEKWVIAEAKKQGFELNTKCVQLLVQRVGIDQWQLFHAIEKLSLIDVISVDNIKDIIEANPTENVFNLFETALRGDIDELKKMIQILERSEDVYRLSALLFTQVFQLAVIVSATKTDDVAKDFGIHPYVISKLTPIAKRLGKNGISKIVAIFAQTDNDMKLSKADPWLLVESALMKVASL
ncbi:MAG TPA: DNA polymerase III subunit delta [Candidatus Angelobacter sp.]|nr:DNA polymerase III subunit delta [Candidatus Angelobacter sp.]